MRVSAGVLLRLLLLFSSDRHRFISRGNASHRRSVCVVRCIPPGDVHPTRDIGKRETGGRTHADVIDSPRRRNSSTLRQRRVAVGTRSVVCVMYPKAASNLLV